MTFYKDEASGTLRMFAKEIEFHMASDWKKDFPNPADIPDNHMTSISELNVYVSTARARIKFFNDLADRLEREHS